MNTRDLVKKIGRENLRQALDVREQTISEALGRGLFPSGCYPTVKTLAEKQGVDVPMGLFNWRKTADQDHTAA